MTEVQHLALHVCISPKGSGCHYSLDFIYFHHPLVRLNIDCKRFRTMKPTQHFSHMIGESSEQNIKTTDMHLQVENYDKSTGFKIQKGRSAHS